MLQNQKKNRIVIVQRHFVAKWNLQFCSTKWGHISFFLMQYKKALRGNAVKTDAVFKRVTVPAKLRSLWMTVYQGEESWILGYSHCALSDWYWSHMPLYWVKCNLTSKVRISRPSSQKAKWRCGEFFIVMHWLSSSLNFCDTNKSSQTDSNVKLLREQWL